jgi:hypothetical protein
MAQTKFDRDIYEAALLGYERSKLDIERKIAELRSMLSGASSASTAKTASRSRRKLSEAARKRIAEAQKKRWARFRRQQGQSKAGAAKSAAKS